LESPLDVKNSLRFPPAGVYPVKPVTRFAAIPDVAPKENERVLYVFAVVKLSAEPVSFTSVPDASPVHISVAEGIHRVIGAGESVATVCVMAVYAGAPLPVADV